MALKLRTKNLSTVIAEADLNMLKRTSYIIRACFFLYFLFVPNEIRHDVVCIISIECIKFQLSRFKIKSLFLSIRQFIYYYYRV